MNKDILNNIKELTALPKKIVILTHVNPDGDAIGSSLALYGFLIQEKHQVSVITPNEYPSFLAWMPYSNDIIVYTHNDVIANDLIARADIIFCLDFNEANRVDKMKDVYMKSKAVKVLIDHHPDPSQFTDIVISDTTVSSTSELIYNVICQLGKKTLVNKDIAACIYVGIITDTGSLSYACNHSELYHVMADLFNKGIDGERIHRLIYDTYSENRMRLLGFCLSEKMKVFHTYHTAYISLTEDEMARFDYKVGDTEGVVNYALSMDGITLAALFTEKEDGVKISLRSKGEVSVNQIARKYYSGGGHRNAAGGSSNKNMKETLAQFEELLPTIITPDN